MGQILYVSKLGKQYWRSSANPIPVSKWGIPHWGLQNTLGKWTFDESMNHFGSQTHIQMAMRQD